MKISEKCLFLKSWKSQKYSENITKKSIRNLSWEYPTIAYCIYGTYAYQVKRTQYTHAHILLYNLMTYRLKSKNTYSKQYALFSPYFLKDGIFEFVISYTFFYLVFDYKILLLS